MVTQPDILLVFFLTLFSTLNHCSKIVSKESNLIITYCHSRVIRFNSHTIFVSYFNAKPQMSFSLFPFVEFNSFHAQKFPSKRNTKNSEGVDIISLSLLIVHVKMFYVSWMKQRQIRIRYHLFENLYGLNCEHWTLCSLHFKRLETILFQSQSIL